MSVKMPVLFVGHGSPMNAVENNEFTRGRGVIKTGLYYPGTFLSAVVRLGRIRWR